MSLFDVEVLPEAEAEAREAFLWYLGRSLDPAAAGAGRRGHKASKQGASFGGLRLISNQVQRCFWSALLERSFSDPHRNVGIVADGVTA